MPQGTRITTHVRAHVLRLLVQQPPHRCDAGVPELTPKKDRDYFVGQAERYTEERLRLQRLAKQVIDGAPPRAGDAR